MGRRGGRGGGAGGAAAGVFGKAAGKAFRLPKRGGGNGAGPGGRPSRRPDGTTRGGGNDGARADRGTARHPDGRTTTKDPIDVVTGEVLLSQTDVHLQGILPLVLRRTHISTYRDGGLFGPAWASTLDQHLRTDADGVRFFSADATVQKYPHANLPGVAFRPEHGRQWTLTLGRDGGYEVTDPQTGRTLRFAAPGDEHGWSRLPLLAVADRNGNRLDLVYRDGTLTELRHSGGYVIAVDTAETGDGERRITALRLLGGTDGGRTLVGYGYDGEGDLAEVVNSSGRPLRFTYDAGRLAAWHDRTGHTYRYEYDGEGRAVRARGTGGFLDVTLAYDPAARTTVITDSLGRTTTYRYNELFQITAETDPLGSTQRFGWDAHDRLLSHTDALGGTIAYAYDEHGNITELTRPDGARFTIAYNALNLPVEMVEPHGAVWRRDYDERGNLTASTDPFGATTRFGYDEAGRPTSVTAPSGAVTRYAPDAAGLPLAVADPLGNVTRYQRDEAGRVTATADPLGNVVRQGWTAEGAPAWRTDADGGTERWTYDAEGNLTAYTDAAGQTTRYEIGPFDLVVAETGPDGARRVFAHDTELRLTAVTDPQGLEWRYTYDAAGNLVGERDFNGRVVGYAHDAAGRLVGRTNGAGETVAFERDVLGNVVRKHGDGRETTFGYDRAGLLVRAADADTELGFERDLIGRLIAETCNGRTVRSAYDVDGNRVRHRLPSGAEAAWSYDAAGRATGVTADGGTVALEYDAAGREVRRRIGAGAALAQQWDGGHRLVAQSVWGAPDGGHADARLLRHRTYRYRPDGVLSGVHDRADGERHFELDRAGRVTAVHARGWSERYAYDAVGRVTSADDGDRDFVGTLLRRAGRVHLEYDAQGRVVARRRTGPSGGTRTWTFGWDADDRLTTVRTPDGTRWRYRYDPLGRRIAKQRLGTDGVVTEQTDFTWDGPLLVEEMHRSRDTPVTRVTSWGYAPGTFRPLYQLRRSTAADAPQRWIDERFHGIVTDLVGAPTELVGAAGTVDWSLRTTVWGVPLTGDVDGCPLRFPGQYHDAETGLGYNYQRYYSPEDGRYQSPDPLGLTPQPDPHAYVLNPTGWSDPLGLCPSDSGDRGQAGHGYARSVVPGGRADGEKVFAGHGEYRRGAGEVTVPPGTRVAVYAEHGQRIHDRVGLGIERGTGRTPVRVYEAGESMPNYTLKAPKNLTIAQESRTVEDARNLSELLKPRMGTVHWAACQELRSR